MRRRLDLGTSLVGAPRLLLLDEPTTGACPRSRIEAAGRHPGPGRGRHRRPAHDPVAGRSPASHIVMGAAAGVAEDLDQRFVDRLRSLPIPRTAVLAGRAVADTAVQVWGLVITTAIGFAVGYRIHGSVSDALVAFALLIVFGFRVRVAVHHPWSDSRERPGRTGACVPDLPAEVRVQRLRPCRDDAELAAGFRRAPADHGDGGRGPRAQSGSGRRSHARPRRRLRRVASASRDRQCTLLPSHA
jgi:hypothetical protein